MDCRRCAWVCGIAMLCTFSLSLLSVAGTALLVNDSAQIARSLRLTFSEPVKIEEFGELLSDVYPTEPSVVATIVNGRVPPWHSMWVRWTPESAAITRIEWLPHGGGIQLDVAIPSDPASIDPSLLRYADCSDTQIVQLLFTGLFSADGETGQLIPELVEHWEVSANGLEWTFKLREDAVWSDGHPVTARDARFSLLRILDPNLDCPPGAPNVRCYPRGWLYAVTNALAFAEGEIEDIDSVGIETVGSYTLRIRLSEPMAQLPWILTIPGFFPLPEHAVVRHGAEWTLPENIVTCGPYRLAGHKPNEWYLLERDPGFFDASSVEILLVKLWVADEGTAWDLYNETLLDTAVVPIQSITDVQDGDVVGLVPGLPSRQIQGTAFCYFNTRIPPFDEPLVRKALTAAVDRELLTEQLATSAGLVAHLAWTLAPAAQLGLEPQDEGDLGVPYDLAQARAWLAEAGYPDGEGLPVIELYHTEGDTLRGPVLWPFLKDQWEQLGCRVEVRPVPAELLRAMFWDQNPPLPFYSVFFELDYLEGSVTPRSFTTFFRNRVGPYRVNELERLLRNAASTTNLEERQVLYQGIERFILEEEALAFALYRLSAHVASREYLERSYVDWLGPDISNWRLIPNSL